MIRLPETQALASVRRLVLKRAAVQDRICIEGLDERALEDLTEISEEIMRLLPATGVYELRRKNI